MIKKICIFLASFFLICSLSLLNRTPVFKDFLDSDEYEISLNNYSNSSSIKTINIKNYPFIFSIKGESCTLNIQEFDLINFLNQMNAKLLFSERLEHCISYYAYSPSIKYQQLVNNEIVNLQVVISTDYVKLGSPIIYGSF